RGAEPGDRAVAVRASARGRGVRSPATRLAGATAVRIRPERVAHLMRREVAEIIEHRLRDPRLGTMVSVTDVEVSRDLSFARIFVSVLAEGDERARVLHALQSAA